MFKGVLFIFLAAAAYACMGLFVKLVGKRLPDEELVFMRCAICLLAVLPLLRFPKKVPIRTHVLPTHIIRATAGFLNMYCFFYSIRFILLSDAMVLNNTMPLFLPLVLFVWKREKISPMLIPGIILGFLGVIFILRPGAELFQPAALLALASGFFMSVSMAGIRQLSQVEPVVRILFYYFAISTLLSAIPLFWTWRTPTPDLWALLIGIGLFAAAYQLLLTVGYTFASASKISPVIYFAVIFSGFFDWLFWGDVPKITSYIGIAFVIIGAIICMRAKERVS